jgi:hypothetical protein
MSSSSSSERSGGRWGPRRLPIALAVVAVLAALNPADAHQAVAAGPVTLQVEGAPLGDISTSGLELTPTFSPGITDYTLRCRPGVNTVGITLAGASGGSIRVGPLSGPRVSSSVALDENQALVVESPGGTAYWIRCLPSDFPLLEVTRPGTPPPGWYLTGNLGSAQGSGTYAMILDSNGTPVWYQRTSGQGAINVTPVAKNVVAWASDPGPGFGTDPNSAFTVYDLATQQSSQLSTATKPLDFHELLPLANGNFLLLASPLRAAVDLRALGLGSGQTIVDCLIQEVTAAGRPVWTWRASAHIKVAESRHPFPVTVNRQLAYDIFHCNSIDQDPSSKDLLLSPHNTDAVYRIRRSSGKVVWKLGGNRVVGDGEQHLTITNDPEKAFYGQHDARFRPGNRVSLYDNHTWYLGPARGVEYQVDTRAGKARLVWQYRSPDGVHSGATGSFRRYQDGDDNVVTWGFKSNALFTEVDAAGRILMNVAFPNGESAYRAIKVPESQFDVDLLRSTAGGPPIPSQSPPKLFTVGVDSSGPRYGSSVTITGSGMAEATAVKFGSMEANSFEIKNDNLITAVAPSGSGAVGVTVTAAGGSSSVTPSNMFVGSDNSFSAGLGSWKPNANAIVTLSNDESRSHPYSLRLIPKKRGLCSTLSSSYPVAANASVTGSAWTKVSRGSDRVRTALIFYDQKDSVIWIEEGSIASVRSRWARATVRGVSPAAAVSVALAVDGVGCSTALYVDDAFLTGSTLFAYQRSPSGVSSVGPDNGSHDGGTVVTVTGAGLSAAKAVKFGGSEAQSMTVTSDNSITAVSPPGSGTVDVVVTTGAGSSLTRRANLLKTLDSTFEKGPGTWVDNVNASILSSVRSRTGAYSLRITPQESGYQSVISGLYPAAGGAVYNLRLWVETPGVVGHARPFMIFYGSAGQILSIEQGPVFKAISARAWTRLTLAARGPEGTAGVAVGVDDGDGKADLYLDDVSLTGSVRFTYR